MREYTRAIIKHNDKFLVIKEHKDSERNIWTFPGGKKDDNEDLIQSCKREVFEELGIEISMWRLERVLLPMHNTRHIKNPYKGTKQM